MIYLLLAALCSLSLVVIFKLFGKYQIESFQAIVVNYIVCVTTGCLVDGIFPFHGQIYQEVWFGALCTLGLLFISGFYITSKTVEYFGIAIASVAQRMCLVISVTFAILFFNEAAPTLKVLGIFVALFSVICINIPPKRDEKEADDAAPELASNWLYLYPIGIFVISGFIEVILQYVQKTYGLAPSEQSVLLFGAAAILGLIVMGIALALGKITFAVRNLIAGVILGIPNYFSIYFLLIALESLDGSVVYPVNNILIVGASAILGYFVFKERLSKVNIIGVVLALLSILLIAGV